MKVSMWPQLNGTHQFNRLWILLDPNLSESRYAMGLHDYPRSPVSSMLSMCDNIETWDGAAHSCLLSFVELGIDV